METTSKLNKMDEIDKIINQNLIFLYFAKLDILSPAINNNKYVHDVGIYYTKMRYKFFCQYYFTNTELVFVLTVSKNHYEYIDMDKIINNYKCSFYKNSIFIYFDLNNIDLNDLFSYKIIA